MLPTACRLFDPQLIWLLLFEVALAAKHGSSYHQPSSHGSHHAYDGSTPAPDRHGQHHGAPDAHHGSGGEHGEHSHDASFDPTIASTINGFVDSLRVDQLRSFVCEKAAVFCKQDEQRQVGAMFSRFDDSIAALGDVRAHFTSFEKDQLNAMENLNDVNAQNTFFMFKLNQLDPSTRMQLQSATSSLLTSLNSGDPNANLSRAAGAFTAQDITNFKTLPTAQRDDEIRNRLRKCNITDPTIVTDIIDFIVSINHP